MQSNAVSRRELLGAGAALALTGAALEADASPEARAAAFSFVLLGDLHYDKLAHHDMEWLAREHPGDVRQVREYTGITDAATPRLFAEVARVVAEHKPKVRAVLQIGDLVEGLCGTQDLAERQDREAVAFVEGKKVGVPFLMVKGNHDVTGPGAPQAFDGVLAPFVHRQAHEAGPGSLAAWRTGDCLFAFFDAYTPGGLDRLEQTLKGAGARHTFVLTHPPFVPYNARSLWHQYSRPQDADTRKRLLSLLAAHQAIVLSGHLHRYGLVERKVNSGRFVQLAVSSVLPSLDVRPKQDVSGVDHYGPDLVNLEPDFEPASVETRRAALAAEAPFISRFEYADAPGYAVVTVDGPAVAADVHVGLGQPVWRTVHLAG